MLETPLKIVVAPDSFKGARSATEVAAAMAAGVRIALGSDVHVVLRPLADGGEGTLRTLLSSQEADLRTVRVRDALGRPRDAQYGVARGGAVAVIEAAEANGLPHVADVRPAPMRADTAGVGDLVRAALDEGVREILLGIGGSATTDGGTGLLRTLGARFLDSQGDEVAVGGAGLQAITAIDTSALDPRVHDVRWRVACDVDNPLIGNYGAAAVFGPQKGATPSEVIELDSGLGQLARVLATEMGIDVAEVAGAGAAGGLPACLMAMLDAELVHGIDLVAEVVGLQQTLADASLVITGEGCFDEQSLRGKVVHGVLRRTPQNCPVVVIAGAVKLSAAESRAAGVTGAFSIAHGAAALDELCDQTEALVRDTTAQIVGLVADGWGWQRHGPDRQPRLSLASSH